MKKLLLCAVLLASVCLFGGCDVARMSSLSALSQPYTGVYECRTLTMDGEDVLGRFEYVGLELKHGGDCTFTYRTAEGGGGEVSGEYELDEERGEMIFSQTAMFRTVERRFPYRDGVIYADFNFRGVLLHAEFAMP